MPITMEAARVNAKLTQTAVAEKLGVSRVTYHKWETGQAKMKPAYFIAFCVIVGRDKDDVILPTGLQKDNINGTEYEKR